MPKIKLSDTAVETIREVCKTFGNKEGELINVLHQVQEKLGYLPAEVQEMIAQELNMSVAKVYGVVTFYSYFTMIPKGSFRFPSAWVLPAMCGVPNRSCRNSVVSLRWRWGRQPPTGNSHSVVSGV